MFGPAYQKINTVFMRDTRGVIIPDEWSCPEFGYLRNLPWRWTEKVDGTNIRLHWDGLNVVVGGRTDEAQVPARLIANLNAAGILDVEKWNAIFPDDDGLRDVTVYGEGYGGKIQAGGTYRQDETVVVFDVRVGPWWLSDDDVKDVATKLGLEVVPAMDEMTLAYATYLVEHQAFKSHWEFAAIEGLVGKPAVNLFNRKGERIIAKIKVKDFRDLERRK